MLGLSEHSIWRRTVEELKIKSEKEVIWKKEEKEKDKEKEEEERRTKNVQVFKITK